MASVAGYKVVIRRAGSPLSFTTELCSTIALESTAIHPLQVSGFQINSTVRDAWERGSTLAFATSTSGGAISSTDIENVNFLFGRVYFKSTHTAVYATGTYVPLQAVAGAHTYTMTMAQDILDDTEFGSAGFRSKAVGLADVQLSMTRWDTLNTFFDDLLIGSTSGPYTTGDPIVAEVQTDPSSTGAPIARGWFKLETHTRSGDVNSLESAEVNLALASIGSDDSPFVKTFSWNDI